MENIEDRKSAELPSHPIRKTMFNSSCVPSLKLINLTVMTESNAGSQKQVSLFYEESGKE